MNRSLTVVLWSGSAVPSRYEPAERVLSVQKARLSPREYSQFERWYLDHFFMDRADALLSNAAHSDTRFGYTTRFDQNGAGPLMGYRKARQWLAGRDPASWDLNSFQQLHVLLMSSRNLREGGGWLGGLIPGPNSEGTSSDHIGRVRDVAIAFDAPDLAQRSFSVARVTVGGEVLRTVPLPEINTVNPYLFYTRRSPGDANPFDEVAYAPLKEWRRFRDRLSPKLIERLSHEEESGPLRREFITELLQDRWRALQGEIRSAKSREAIIDAVASFHYDFLSLHPFANGNGRMARLISERLFSEYGLPPPIWSHFGEDVILAKGDFAKLFRDALTLSHEFHRDLELALQNGLPYDAVAIGTLLPGVPASVLARHQIEPADFLAWVAASHFQTPDTGALVKRYLRWRDLKGSTEWEMPPVRLATAAHIAEFGTRSPSSEVFARRRRDGYGDGWIFQTTRAKGAPPLGEILDLFSKGKLSANPAASLRGFNATMVRSPRDAAGWLSVSAFGRDPATEVGVTRAYDTPLLSRERATGGGPVLVDIGFAKPKVASLDASFLTGLSAAPQRLTKGAWLVGGGIEAEAVETVTVTSAEGDRILTARRTGFRTLEVRESVSGREVSTTYQWAEGTGWTIPHD